MGQRQRDWETARLRDGRIPNPYGKIIEEMKMGSQFGPWKSSLSLLGLRSAEPVLFQNQSAGPFCEGKQSRIGKGIVLDIRPIM